MWFLSYRYSSLVTIVAIGTLILYSIFHGYVMVEHFHYDGKKIVQMAILACVVLSVGFAVRIFIKNRNSLRDCLRGRSTAA